MSYATEWILTRASVRGGEESEERTSLEYDSLQVTKRRVPDVIKRVGTTKWYNRVNRPSAEVFKLEKRSPVISRAYFKMHEIFESCALPYPKNSLHLCEAPGGFIQWLSDNHPEPNEWMWSSVSIEDGPTFDTSHLPLDRGEIIEGDIFQVERWKRCFVQGSFQFVTADGATDMNHEDIEREHLPLLRAQTLVAVHSLSFGGNYVVKFFEGGLHETQSIIAILTTLFETVSIIKPLTSRKTNSERYLVCRNLRSRDLAQYNNLVISHTWLQETQEILDRMMRIQNDELSRVLDEFDGKNIHGTVC